MSEEIILGIDHGYGWIKTAHADMTTSLTTYRDKPAITSENLLSYTPEGETRQQYYELGGRRNILRRDKTVNDEYWVMTLGAIAMELNARNLPGKQNVRIAAGLPLYKFTEEAAKFRKYLNRPGVHEFAMGNQYYAITITGVHIYPQGYSALIKIAERLKAESIVHIIDIGSWTTDTLTMERGVPVAHTERSIENGVIRCIDQIMQAVQDEQDIELSDLQIDDALRGRRSISERFAKSIREKAAVWAVDMVDYLYQLGFKFSACPVNFIGGGASILKRYLPQEKAKNFYSVYYWDDIHQNAVGFENACKAQRMT